MRFSRPTTTKTISKFSFSLHCVLDPDMLLLYRVKWTKAVDNVAETVRTICNNSVAALKRFLNTELAGPCGPTTTQFEGEPTSVARHRPRAPSLALAFAHAVARAGAPASAPSPAFVVARPCRHPRLHSPPLTPSIHAVRLHSPAHRGARRLPGALPRSCAGGRCNVTKGSAKWGAELCVLVTISLVI